MRTVANQAQLVQSKTQTPTHVPSKSESKSSKKRKQSKFDVAGDLMDKLLGMQEKSEKMMMEMERKRVRLEESKWN